MLTYPTAKLSTIDHSSIDFLLLREPLPVLDQVILRYLPPRNYVELYINYYSKLNFGYILAI